MRFSLRLVRTLLIVVGLAPHLAAAGGEPGRVKDEKPRGKLFCIVAPASFHGALKEYVEHKKKLLPTELVSLEKVLKASAGRDDPERLKRFLYDAWRKRGLGYVLLVGDVDVMPVRYMVLDRVTPAAFDYAFYPSDLYYADLAKQDGSFDDWNARKDGFHADYFGEVRGEKNKKDAINFDQVDYRPEVAVGRWPVSTEAEVRLIAAKSMAYENVIRAGTHPGLKQAAFFHVQGWVDARARLDRMAARLTDWKTEKRFFSDGNPKFKTDPPNQENLLATLNKGVGLVVHVGHGSEHSWEGCFATASLKKVKNADRLPVMFSVGCSTCYFAALAPYDGYVDIHGKEHKGVNNGEVFTAPPPAPAPYQKGRHNPTGLGEQVLKRENGAVAYIGCNTGSQPCALSLLEGFLIAAGKSGQPRVGDCWASAVSYYYDKEGLARLVPTDDWYPPSIFFQGMKFMLFGDPTLPLAAMTVAKK
ncbi:MAG: C25 family cysteine peptidase [Gemmataceae bacterium]